MPRRHSKSKKNTQVSNKAAIYLRTSDLEAQAPEKSQEGQLRTIQQRIIEPGGYQIYRIYRDTMSGTISEREQYQQMLRDAAQGHFSYVVISEIDRFSRDVAEGARAINDLNEREVIVLIASSPGRDHDSPEGKFQTHLELALAQLESEKTGFRTSRGMRTKYQLGEWPHYAPEGYINKERKTSGASLEVKKNNGRYERWVEIDPEQSKLVRLAFDLLLEGTWTEEKICYELHARGYRLKKGTPLIKEVKGKTKANKGALSRIFHNWFYAGWIVVDNKYLKLLPKMMQGKWEPIVTTEEFERVQEILLQRNQKRMPRKNNFYLLQGLIYISIDEDENDRKVS